MASVASAKRYSSAKSRSLTASRLLAVMREKPRSRASALRSMRKRAAGERARAQRAESARTAARRKRSRVALEMLRRAPAASAKAEAAARAACAWCRASECRDCFRPASASARIERRERRRAISRAASFTYMRNSVATISLRLRPVCSLRRAGRAARSARFRRNGERLRRCESSSHAGSDCARALDFIERGDSRRALLRA